MGVSGELRAVAEILQFQKTLDGVASLCVRAPRAKSSQASFNQQIAQYRGKIDERQLTDLAISHFEEQLSKNQQQVSLAH